MDDVPERLKELGIDPDSAKTEEEAATLNLLKEALNNKETDEDEKKPEDVIYNNYDEIPNEEELKNLQADFTEERINELSEKSEALKTRANELFREAKYEEALNMYCEAIDCAPAAKTKQRAVLFANRAATKIKMGSPKAAIDDCTHAVELDDRYVRAFHRRAELYEADNQFQPALDDHKAVLEFDPDNSVSREASVRLAVKVQEEQERIKTEAMKSLKELGNLILKPFGLSTDSFQMQPDGKGGYSINMKQ